MEQHGVFFTHEGMRLMKLEKTAYGFNVIKRPPTDETSSALKVTFGIGPNKMETLILVES